jgi:DNA polymerase (family 10)
MKRRVNVRKHKRRTSKGNQTIVRRHSRALNRSKKIKGKKPSIVKKTANRLVKRLTPYSSKIMITGSLRRNIDSPRDIDILVIPKKNQKNKIDKILSNYKKIRSGEKINTIEIKGIKTNIFISNKNSWGAASLYSTGPDGYGIGLRVLAKNKGMKLNQYGLWDRETNELIASKTEEDIYEALGLRYKIPDIRGDPWKTDDDLYYMLLRLKKAEVYDNYSIKRIAEELGKDKYEGRDNPEISSLSFKQYLKTLIKELEKYKVIKRYEAKKGQSSKAQA